MAPRGPQKGMEAEPMAGVCWSTPPQASCFSRWRNHGDPGKDRGPGEHSEDWVCAQLCRSRASGRLAMGKLRVRFEPSSPRISTEDKQIISTWARGEGGGEGEGCQREAAVQIPPDSSPAAPTSPVIPPNKLQSKQGAQDPAVAATLSSFRGIFPSSPSPPTPSARPQVLLPSHGVYTSCPELDLQGRCLSKAQQSWLGPRRKGQRRSFPKAFRLRFYTIGTAGQHPSSGLTFHL